MIHIRSFLTRLLASIALLSMMMALTACPYNADIPIDEPSISVDNALLGTWSKESQFEEHPPYFVFEQKDAYRYSVTEFEWNTEGKKKGYKPKQDYTAHLSKVGNETFVNVRFDGKYHFFKATFPSTDEMVLVEVTNNITEKFQQSSALKAFIAQHSNLSFFYNNDSKQVYKKRPPSGNK